ncbi:MAG TPA: hypothetical protein VNL71_03555, partial [Chloroflexota bacterium]|nr:hypothetical protein [Chloroflexota bacterium]
MVKIVASGPEADNPWLAEITGPDAKYGLKRDFSKIQVTNRNGWRWLSVKVEGPGLYQLQEAGRKGATV